MRGFFLQGARGRIYCLHHAPEHPSQVIVVPPFAEEMNKSRRMFTLLAHSLIKRGHGVLIPDLYGTGDSEGDFGDARWEIWKEDLALVSRYLGELNARAISLVALRLGALLAVEFASRAAVNRIVLWQPVASGNSFMTQFLRLRVAAAMAAGIRETTDNLRQRLSEGESLEIAGYTLSPALASAIGAANMQAFALKSAVHWIEIGAAFSASGRRVIEGWRKHTTVNESLVAGLPFWTTSEITIVPELIERTVAVFEQP